MNKPQTHSAFALEKSTEEAPHILPQNHKDTARELPEIYYKNSQGSIERVDRKNLEHWSREAQ